MKEEIKYFIYAFTLGALLIGYGHSNFATKDMITIVVNQLRAVADNQIRLETKIDNYIINRNNKP